MSGSQSVLECPVRRPFRENTLGRAATTSDYACPALSDCMSLWGFRHMRPKLQGAESLCSVFTCTNNNDDDDDDDDDNHESHNCHNYHNNHDLELLG